MPEITVNCPDRIHIPRHPEHKPDRKRKLSINPTKGVARCWSCGFRPRRDVAALLLEVGVIYDGPVLPTAPDAPDPGRLPLGYTTDFTTRFGARVLRHLRTDRHLDPLTIVTYEIGYAELGPCAGRIIIPLHDVNGLRVGWQARAFARPNDRLKYLSPTGMPPVLFNASRVHDVVVITEGPFDALRLPEFAVAAIGKDWSDTKTALVLQLRPRTVIVALDPDAAADAERICTALYGCVPCVVPYFLPPECGDLGAAPPPVVRGLRAVCHAARAA